MNRAHAYKLFTTRIEELNKQLSKETLKIFSEDPKAQTQRCP